MNEPTTNEGHYVDCTYCTDGSCAYCGVGNCSECGGSRRFWIDPDGHRHDAIAAKYDRTRA